MYPIKMVGADLCVCPYAQTEPKAGHIQKGAHTGAPLQDMKYDPDKHHRRSIRLKEYDYSQAGAYFVTVCVKDRECLFGDIIDGKMQLNEAGEMIEKWCRELVNKFKHVQWDEFVIMPNHFHGIVSIVGADLRVCPENTTINKGAHTGAPLHSIVQWYKTMTTNDYIRGVKSSGWRPFPGKLWQRNYYEHIVHTEEALNNIRSYIQANPLIWQYDIENPAHLSAEIDRVLAKHYGFTDEELDFIINYDIKYRMGREAEDVSD